MKIKTPKTSDRVSSLNIDKALHLRFREHCLKHGFKIRLLAEIALTAYLEEYNNQEGK